MDGWTSLHAQVFRAVFDAINMEAVKEEWNKITDNVIDSIIKSLLKKLKELVRDWHHQDYVLDGLLNKYLNKQGRRTLILAAGKRNGMLQAKMQGKLKNLLKAKCYMRSLKH